jgi:hypothetical protein
MGCLRGKTHPDDVSSRHRAWNPHRPRRIYVEIQAIPLRVAQSSRRIEPFTWHQYTESSHNSQPAFTHSRQRQAARQSTSCGRAIYQSAPRARTIRPSYRKQISANRHPANQFALYPSPAGSIHTCSDSPLRYWLRVHQQHQTCKRPPIGPSKIDQGVCFLILTAKYGFPGSTTS